MRRAVPNVVAALLLAAPAFAQDMPLAFDAASVIACFEGTASDAPFPDCVGAASGVCMNDTEGGSTTIGMASCTSREADEWDRQLNVEYRALRPLLEGRDVEATAAPSGIGIGRAEALRDAQRAWIAFRDAECNLRYALVQDGTIRMLTGAGCVLSLTARRALELRDLRRSLEDGL